jgi:hypothetical protein
MKRFRQISIAVVIVLLLFSPVVYALTWKANKRLSNLGGGSDAPAVAVDGSTMYVVWSDNTAGNYELIFKRSIDGGATWEADTQLTNTAGHSHNPAIAVDGSNIYVIWRDNTPGNDEIYFKRSTDGGVTWSEDQQLTTNTSSSIYPAIAVVGANVYVVWSDNSVGNYEVYFKRSSDRGLTWKADRRFSNTTGDSGPAAIVVGGANIYVVWCDNTEGNYEIYFKRSIDGGVSWNTYRRITNNAGRSVYPDIAVDGSNIYVVWEDNASGNSEIHFNRSVDGGVTWKTDTRLTTTFGLSYDPAIAVEGSNIYLVWWESHVSFSEIYFKRSNDRGVTWTANKQFTNNAGEAEFPAIAVAGSNIHVFWKQSISYNYLYYKKGVLD